MGVTIHFEAKINTRAEYFGVIELLRRHAAESSWPMRDIPEEKRELQRVKDEMDWTYTGMTFGLELFPHPYCDPLRFEFDENLYVQEFVKTQFAGPETHIAIIALFHAVEQSFEFLHIEDEGEYWETNNKQVLYKHLASCDNALRDLLAKHPTARGPVRLANGRMADLIS